MRGQTNLVVESKSPEQRRYVGFQLFPIFFAYLIRLFFGLDRYDDALHVVDHASSGEFL